MLTEQVLRQIEEDLKDRKARKSGLLSEAVADKTGHAGGSDDPPGEKPTDNDPGQGSGDTEGSIKALADENFEEKSDFFKLSQILKGLAAVSDKDETAKDFLAKVGEAVREIAGASGSPRDSKRTDPNNDEPLKNHPERTKETPGSKAGQPEVEKGLPKSEAKSTWGNAQKKLKDFEKAASGFKKAVAGENSIRFGGAASYLLVMIGEIVDALGGSGVMDQLGKIGRPLSVGHAWGEGVELEDFLVLPVLAEMLDDLVEKSNPQPFSGRDWQELRGFADFINKDAARVAKAVGSKDPEEVLDKAKAMVTNVEILIKRMVGVYPSMQKAAEFLDKAGREMLRAMG